MTDSIQTGSPDSTSNVNPAEIAKFSALASRWWDPNSEFKPLHAINPLRLDWIKQILAANAAQPGKGNASTLSGLKCLDVGCGGGILSEAMAREGADVKGI